MRWPQIVSPDERCGLRTTKSWRPDISTLVSSRRISPQAMVARKPDHQGDHEGNRNTIAQGRPGISGVPVVTNLRAFY
ncbi:MAG: hypothetical protein KGJ00_21535, partial [Bradyrhizobium sp.]|nr:hypothetical protein [Bradyrhizobium sp.]